MMGHSDQGQEQAISILGGTGDQGLGLALRFAAAGRTVVIGSRRLEKAQQAVKEVCEAVPSAQVSGFENADASSRAGIVILSVPFEHTADTVKSVREALREGQEDSDGESPSVWVTVQEIQDGAWSVNGTVIGIEQLLWAFEPDRAATIRALLDS